MATCPECKASSRVIRGFTVEEILVDVGPAVVAGEEEKRSARVRYKLNCPCGWSVIGDISDDGTYLVVPRE